MSSSPIHRINEVSCGLLVIDLQEKFASSIRNWDAVLAASIRLVHFFHLLRAPIVITEQYPKGLGVTVSALRDVLSGGHWELSTKTTFSSHGTDELKGMLKNRQQWILCGIETHVCVQQTVLDLLKEGRDVFLAVDAISSRHAIDHDTALARMIHAGAVVSTTESLIFEVLKDAKHPLFKQASALVK